MNKKFKKHEDAKAPVTAGMKEPSSLEDREGKGSRSTTYQQQHKRDRERERGGERQREKK